MTVKKSKTAMRGRPTRDPLIENINARVSEAQHELYLALGGSSWLRAELSALKAGQGEAVAWIHPNYLGADMSSWAFEASRARLSPDQVALYLAPSTPDATQVMVPRELLGRLVVNVEILDKRPRSICRDCADYNGVCPSGLDCDISALTKELRALLAQSEGVKP